MQWILNKDEIETGVNAVTEEILSSLELAISCYDSKSEAKEGILLTVQDACTNNFDKLVEKFLESAEYEAEL